MCFRSGAYLPWRSIMATQMKCWVTTENLTCLPPLTCEHKLPVACFPCSFMQRGNHIPNVQHTCSDAPRVHDFCLCLIMSVQEHLTKPLWGLSFNNAGKVCSFFFWQTVSLTHRSTIRVAGRNQSSETLPLFIIPVEQDYKNTDCYEWTLKQIIISGFWPGLILQEQAQHLTLFRFQSEDLDGWKSPFHSPSPQALSSHI